MCSAAKAIGNTELENKFAEGENIWSLSRLNTRRTINQTPGAAPDVPRSSFRHQSLTAACNMKDACSEVWGGGLAAPQTLLVFGAALIKAFILKSGCIRVQSCSISEFQNPDDLTCDTV